MRALRSVEASSELPVVPYPPAPWRSRGSMWMAFFKADSPLKLPAGVSPVLLPNWVVLTIVRYLEGALQYDEFVIGSLVRQGLRFGVYVNSIWVDDVASLWGGRRIWGLHKELARFDWSGSSVSISDERGTIASLALEDARFRSPPLWMLAPGFGQLDGRWAFSVGSMLARLGRSRMHVQEWSERFPYRLNEPSRLGFVAGPMRVAAFAPKILGPVEG